MNQIKERLNIDPNLLYWLLLTAILSAGTVLRLSGFTASGIWYDESLPFEAARLPFQSMLEATKFTFAPPLWGIIVWISVRVFGQNELALRLPALAASLFTLWLVYKIADDFNLNHFTKICALLFAALIPYQLWTAQDGRAYAIISALYLGAAWFAFRDRWLGLTACAGLLLYSHYASPFYLLGIYGAATINHSLEFKHLKKIFFSGSLALISFSFWVPVYLATLKGDFTVPPISISDLITMLYRLIFADVFSGNPILTKLAATMIVFTAFFAFIFSVFLLLRQLLKTDTQQKTIFQPKLKQNELVRYLQLTLLAFFPLLAMIIWSLLWKNFIYYRLLVAMSIPMMIWSFYTLSKAPFAIRYTLLPIWIILLLAGIVNWSPLSKSGDMQAVTALVKHEWREGDVIYHITGTSYLPFLQYLRDKPEYLLDEKLHDWLLPTQLIKIFALPQAPLENLHAKRAWIFYSRDAYLTEQAKQRADAYVQNGTLVGIVNAWQFSQIEVYLVSTPTGQGLR